MQDIQLSMCRDFAFSGLRAGTRFFRGIAKDRSGTAIMAYAFLSSLIALAAFVAFNATGTAVANLYENISTVFVASMPQ